MHRMWLLIVDSIAKGLITVAYGPFTLSVSGTLGLEKMGCVKKCRMFHFTQGQGPIVSYCAGHSPGSRSGVMVYSGDRQCE